MRLGAGGTGGQEGGAGSGVRGWRRRRWVGVGGG